MGKKSPRKPIAHFFIKKELQIRLIKKIVLAVLISTLVCMATLLLTYLAKYKSAAFYRVTFNVGASIGNRENIIAIIFPSLLISSIVNLFLGVGLGLYTSRKYAVPIFKLEQWVNLLRSGHLTAQLRFREKEEMLELSTSCNELTEEIRSKFEQIEKEVVNAQHGSSPGESLDNIQKVLSTLQLSSESIEVHTSFFRPPQQMNETEKPEDR
jgi:methyl-accepting chemotaxis protein